MGMRVVLCVFLSDNETNINKDINSYIYSTIMEYVSKTDNILIMDQAI